MSSLPAGLGTASRSPSTNTHRTVIAGFFNKVEPRALGVASRRRFWFALSDESPYLYWFREKSDVSCVGRVPLSGAAFTYDPRDTGRFEIRIDGEVHIFEASSQRQRADWLKAMQDVRKRHYQAILPSQLTLSNHELAALHSHATSPQRTRSTTPTPAVVEQTTTAPIDIVASSSRRVEVEASEDLEGTASKADDTPVPMPRRRTTVPAPNTGQGDIPAELLGLLGPRNTSSTDTVVDSKDPVALLKDAEPHLAQSAPTSTFYLDPSGDLNDRSLEMPREVFLLRTDALIHRTQEKIVRMEKPARRALEKARASLHGLRGARPSAAGTTSPDRPRINCEDCKKVKSSFGLYV